MSGRVWVTLGFLCLAVLGEGCRRVYTFAPAEGTITQGGKPMAGLHVVFYPDPDSGGDGPKSWGMTDVTGHYRLRTDNGNDGAIVGNHRVCIMVPHLPTHVLGSGKSGLPRLNKVEDLMKGVGTGTTKIPAVYGNISETPLRTEVCPGGIQTFDFDLP